VGPEHPRLVVVRLERELEVPAHVRCEAEIRSMATRSSWRSSWSTAPTVAATADRPHRRDHPGVADARAAYLGADDSVPAAHEPVTGPREGGPGRPTGITGPSLGTGSCRHLILTG
jgi:hypothetical protein